MTASQVEVKTVERAILCTDGRAHYWQVSEVDAARMIYVADNCGLRCEPHRFATRERIVTGWTEANT